MDNRIKGMLMGVFMGDAFGAAFEFPKTILIPKGNEGRKKTGQLTEYSRLRMDKIMRGKKSLEDYTEYPIGCITDDSELTIAFLTSLFYEEDLKQRRKRYYDWVHKGDPEFGDGTPMGLGRNTKAIFKWVDYDRSFIAVVGEGPDLKMVYDDKLPSGGNSLQSNGSLMRATPLALLMNHPSLYEMIVEDTMITNPSSANIQANLLYVTACIYALKGYSPDFILKRVAEICEESSETAGEFIKIMTCVRDGKVYDGARDEGKKGWVCVAFYYAMYGLSLLRDGRNYREIMVDIVGQGGDTDTNAAIAGGLVGACVGFDEMERDEITRWNIAEMTAPSTGKSRMRRVPQEDWKKILARAEGLVGRSKDDFHRKIDSKRVWDN